MRPGCTLLPLSHTSLGRIYLLTSFPLKELYSSQHVICRRMMPPEFRSRDGLIQRYRIKPLLKTSQLLGVFSRQVPSGPCSQLGDHDYYDVL